MWHFLERFDHLTWIVFLSKTFGLPAAVISLVKIDFLDAIENLNDFNPTSTTHMRRSSEQFYGSTSQLKLSTPFGCALPPGPPLYKSKTTPQICKN